MAKMTFASACSRLKEYFSPLGFEATLDSPTSITARVFDTTTGENIAVVAGLPWGVTVTNEHLVSIIGAIEQEIQFRELAHKSTVYSSLG